MKKLTVIASSAIIILYMTSAPGFGEEAKSIAPEQSINLLKKGNARFQHDTRDFPNQSGEKRKETADKGQFPYVTILSCSDSRVPLEHIFDAGIGDLFVVRVAGNVCDVDEIGTIEYGIGHLHTPLLVVLGHTKCGAVTAVVKGDEVHGSIPLLVDNIVPAVERAKAKLGNEFSQELLDYAIEQNVWQSIEDLLSKSEEAVELVREGKLKIVGALYNLNTGKVEWLGEHPSQKELLSRGASGHESGRSSLKVVLIMALLVLVPFIVLTAIYVLFMYKKTRIKNVSIKKRMAAGILGVVLAITLASFSGLSYLYLVHEHLTIGTVLAIVIVPAAVSVVFAYLMVDSIIQSFKLYINALKQK